LGTISKVEEKQQSHKKESREGSVEGEVEKDETPNNRRVHDGKQVYIINLYNKKGQVNLKM